MKPNTLGWVLLAAALIAWAAAGRMPAISFLSAALLLGFGLQYALKATGAEK